MTLGVCDGCGRLGIVGTRHTTVRIVKLDEPQRFAHTFVEEPCGTHRRPEPPEPERKEPLYPRHGNSPERET